MPDSDSQNNVASESCQECSRLIEAYIAAVRATRQVLERKERAAQAGMIDDVGFLGTESDLDEALRAQQEAREAYSRHGASGTAVGVRTRMRTCPAIVPSQVLSERATNARLAPQPAIKTQAGAASAFVTRSSSRTTGPTDTQSAFPPKRRYFCEKYPYSRLRSFRRSQHFSPYGKDHLHPPATSARAAGHTQSDSTVEKADYKSVVEAREVHKS